VDGELRLGLSEPLLRAVDQPLEAVLLDQLVNLRGELARSGPFLRLAR
jgi:hypothetical protein